MPQQPTALFAGKTVLETLYYVDELPSPNKKTDARSTAMASGGNALNAAVIFSHLGGNASFVTKIGHNNFSQFLTHDFDTHGIHVIDCAFDLHEYALPIATIMIDRTGDRTITASPTPEEGFEFKKDDIVRAVEEADIVEIDTRYTHMTCEVVKLAKEKGKKVILDAGNWRDGLFNILPYVDIAICSEDFFPPGTQTQADVKNFLNEQNIHEVSISCGNKPILYYEGNNEVRIPVPNVKAVDTSGAGDFLHGAFCYYYASGKTIPDALSEAAKIASRSCQFYGTREWLKSPGSLSTTPQQHGAGAPTPQKEEQPNTQLQIALG